jgi:Fe-S cluster assembly iron-binding protein IscA
MFKNYYDYKQNRKKMQIKLLPKVVNNNKDINIAIIIPYRNRIIHLKKFINHINNLNKNPNHNFDLYIIDQNNFDRFNRGLTLNIGYYMAKKIFNYDRYIFHDVDSYPSQEIFNLYFAFIDKNIHFASPYLGYKYNFDTFMGGVIGFKSNDFEKINGFSSTFFGWGGEDDSIYNRCVFNNIEIFRPSSGSYSLDEHEGPKSFETNKNKQINILNDLHVWNKDGIKQLDSFYINYKNFELDNFIDNYNIPESNLKNNAELLFNFNQPQSGDSVLQTRKNDTQSIWIYKIDYLALHNKYKSILLSKNFVNQKINEKINKDFKNQRYFQHKLKPNYISVIEPLIYWNEIKDKIINTFTKPKKFNINFETNKRTEKINNILKNEFKQSSKLNVDDLEKTLKFIYDTYNELIYIRIRDNKIECAYHIYNPFNSIDWYKNLKYKSKYLNESVIDLLDNLNKSYYTIKNPHFQPANNCLLGFDSYNYFEGNPTSYVKGFIDMINYTIKQFKQVPDSDILINRKDFAYLRKDDKYSYTHVLNEKINNPLDKYWIIGSQSKTNMNKDIPVPSSDEWDTINKKEKFETKWSQKKETAIFRGSSTGCGTYEKNNPRMKLADLSFKNKEILDVALSKLTRRIKAYNEEIFIVDEKKYNYLVGSFMDHQQQSEYKYIFNIEGNAQSYRYPTEFKKHSVVLNVESQFYMWFEPLLKNNKHYIKIDSDYNNVLSTVKYLKENDKKAEQIAENGYRFAKKYINKKMIGTYWFYFMYYINELSH